MTADPSNAIHSPPPENAPIKPLTAWCQLLRLPNIFTVFGDPLVGFCLAGGVSWKTAALAMVTGAFAYWFGLITNDIADIETDKKERPQRPLPSGAISMRAAKIAATLLALATLGTASVISWEVSIIAVLLLTLVLAYNFMMKRSKIAGPAGMALCRISSLLLGVTATTGFTVSASELDPLLAVPFIIYLFYIFGLSRLAYDETITQHKVSGRYELLIATSIPLATFVFITVSPEYATARAVYLFFMGTALLLFIFGFRIFVILSAPFRTPKAIQEAVREIIGAIPIFQAGWILLSHHPHAIPTAIGLLTLCALFHIFSRRIAAT